MSTKQLTSLLIALALVPVAAVGGEQVILKKDFNGNTMQKTRMVDGWALLSYCPGELSREKGTLKLKATPAKDNKVWGRMLCPFRNGNVSGAKIRLHYKVKGTGSIRFGAIRYQVGQKAPKDTDCFWSDYQALESEYKDYEYSIDFSDSMMGSLNFMFDIKGEGEAVIDSMTVTASGDAGCEIKPSEPIMVKETDSLPCVTFQTNRPGKTFLFFNSVPNKTYLLPGSKVVADARGIVTVPGTSLLKDEAVQEVSLALEGNAMFQPPVGAGCKFCEMVLDRIPTVGTVVITRIPADEYEASMQAAKQAKIGNAKNILILADSIWDFYRGANEADRINFFLRKAQDGKIKVANYAVHGDRIDKVTARFKGNYAAVDHGKERYRDLKKETPDLILIMLGHNDTAANSRDNFATSKISPELQKAKYEELLAALKESYPQAGVILLTPLAVHYEGILKRCEERRKAGAKLIFRYGDPDKLATFRKVLEEVASEHKLQLLDMYTPTEHLDNKASYFMPDCVHLSPRGHGLLARLVLQELGK